MTIDTEKDVAHAAGVEVGLQIGRQERDALMAELAEALKAVNLARHSDAETDWLRATDLTDAALAKYEGTNK